MYFRNTESYRLFLRSLAETQGEGYVYPSLAIKGSGIDLPLTNFPIDFYKFIHTYMENVHLMQQFVHIVQKVVFALIVQKMKNLARISTQGQQISALTKS